MNATSRMMLAAVAALLPLSAFLHAQSSGNFQSAPPGFNSGSGANRSSGGSSTQPGRNENAGSSSARSVQPSVSPYGAASSQTNRAETTLPTGMDVPDTYVIMPSDVISVTVFGEPDLSVNGIRVNSAGVIPIPLLGDVKIQGLSLLEARNLITQKFAKDYLVNPQVVVALISTSANEYIITGQINSPGTRQIPTDGKMTILRAIHSSGGFTKIANPKAVTIQRKVGKESKIITVNVKDIEMGKAPDMEILPGDFIKVPESIFGFDM